MATAIAYWVGFIGGRMLSAILILSLVLAFVRNQTRKNIVIAGVIAYFIAVFFNVCGNIDGRLLTWPLAKFLLLNALMVNGVVFAVITLLTIWRHWNTQKWFAKGMLWVAGVLYGLVIFLAFPMEIKEQYEIRKIAHELTYRQFNALEDYEKAVITYKMAGVKDANIYKCVRASQESDSIQDIKFKEIVETCRDIIYSEQSGIK